MNEEEIIENVTGLFMQLGVKSLTMSDIAKRLGISKKTLYKYVRDKSDLVDKTMQFVIKSDQEDLLKVGETKSNAIEKMVAINDIVSTKLKNMQPAVIYDIKTYYPKAWKMMEEHKTQFIFSKVKTNIQEGIGEGLYRKNINPEITTKLYLSLVLSLFEDNLFDFESSPYYQVHRELARYHLRGIVNEKGLAYLKTLFNTIQY